MSDMQGNECQSSFRETPPPVLLALLGIISLFFVMQMLVPPFNRFAMAYLAMDTTTFLAKGYLWQPLTAIFLHGNLFHYLGNMMFLYFFGLTLAQHWRPREFLLYFLGCGLASSLCFYGFHQALVLLCGAPPASGIGASGAIFGLMLAYGMMFGERYIQFLFIPMKAKYAVAICVAIEILLLVAGTQDGVGHIAHLAGGIAGALCLKLVWKLRDRQAGVSTRKARAASRIAGLEVMSDDHHHQT